MANEPQRRAADVVTTTEKTLDRSLATGALVFLIGFLYQLSEVLKTHTCYCDFLEKPAAGGEIVFAIVCGLGAVAMSLGLDVSRLIKGFK